ncbi:conserved exported hypothetical protein [Vibrio coralliirubri]|uniref:hypothetical protein n=1 Tax=Vibrio coralliirubri TaxID=1516159 RepID=UPI0006340C1E|nr:hypothetical protein [Vibrio coralliirubri]CDU08761.1 conserved exported hypothetical protein [Vibrio coralliirubri]
MTKFITLSTVIALVIGATSSWAEESARVDFPDAETQQKLNKKWEHALPFHAQKAIDLGYALPLPFSLSFIGNASEQNIEMYDLGVQVGDVDLGDKYDLSQVSFGDPEIESKSMQLRAAAWVFPFLQMGVHVGRFSGGTQLTAEIPTSLFKACDNHPRLPTCAKESVSTPEFYPDVEGTNWGFSMNIVGQVGDFTYVLPASMTHSRTDDERTNTKTMLFSPRVGQLIQTESWGNIFPYVGAAYMHSEGLTQENNALGVDGLSYQLSQQSAEDYSAIIGANWNITKTYGANLEFIGGPGRKIVNVIMTYSY